MKVVKRIIEFYLNELKSSKASSDLRMPLERLVFLLKSWGYPAVELADIISIQIMLDYVLSSERLIKSYPEFIEESLSVIDDILGDRLYVKVEPRIISLEVEFTKNIALSPKRYDDMLTEKVRDLLLNES